MRLGTLAGAAVLAMIACVLAGAANAQTGDLACGALVTEDTVLTHDLLGCDEGVTIAAPNVLLDLGGHSIAGRGTGTGVRVDAEGATVRNGSVSGFGIGLAGSSGGLTLDGSAIHHNGTGILLQGRSQVVGNKIFGNGGHGILSSRADGSLFDANIVSGNGGDGVHLIESVSVITGNTFHKNGGAGLFVDDLCFGGLQAYRVGSNMATHNGGLGIDIHFAACPIVLDLLDAGGNAANHNADGRECTMVVCARNQGQARKLAAPSAAVARTG
jgi:parallel beta-helix repeat protein